MIGSCIYSRPLFVDKRSRCHRRDRTLRCSSDFDCTPFIHSSTPEVLPTAATTKILALQNGFAFAVDNLTIAISPGSMQPGDFSWTIHSSGNHFRQHWKTKPRSSQNHFDKGLQMQACRNPPPLLHDLGG
jgi:hypothetical protein